MYRTSVSAALSTHEPEENLAALAIVDQARQHFDSLAPTYDQYCARRRQYLETLDGIAWQELTSQDHPHHLDVGCGTGRLLSRIAGSGGNSEGIDVSPVMWDLCRRKGLMVACGDFLNCGGGPRYGVITMQFNVLGYLAAQSNLETVLRHTASLLLPGGILVADVVNPLCIAYNKLRRAAPAALARAITLPLGSGVRRVRYNLPGRLEVGAVEFLIVSRKRLLAELTGAGFSSRLWLVEYSDGISRHLPFFLRAQIVVVAALGG